MEKGEKVREIDRERREMKESKSVCERERENARVCV